MPETDAFDPTHALDGWRPPAPVPLSLQELDLDKLLHPPSREAKPLLAHAGASGFDPTHLLDGWRPPAPAPLDLELKSMLRAGSVPDQAKMARLKARGYEMLDVEDVELVEGPPPAQTVVEAWVREAPPAPPPAEDAVDVALPEEEVWPLFMEEAQILDAGAAPTAGDESPPRSGPEPEFEPEGPVAAELPQAEADEGLELAPSVIAEVPAVEAQATESECAATDEGVEAEEVASEFEAPAARAAAHAVVTESGYEPGVELAPPAEEGATHEWPAAEDARSLADTPAITAGDVCGPETAEPGRVGAAEDAVPELDEAVTRMPAPEPKGATPVLDLHAFPPPTPQPPPRFIDDIQLPAVPPPAVLEAPVLDFRVVPPLPGPDPEAVIAGIELPQATPSPVSAEMPELDIAAFTPRAPEPDPRLLLRWQAGAWTALARRVAGASEELLQTPDGLRVESRAAQWLCAIWPPQLEDAPLGRWPELAALVAAETMADALQQLLAELPDEALLWSADLEADWDLVAELVLHQDTGLRPAESRALHELAAAERKARLARLGEGYALQGRVARRRA